jgi:hypothetical protein
MKTTIKVILMICTGSIFSACKKDAAVTSNAGVLNVTNAVLGGSQLTLMTNSSIVSSGNTIASNNYAFMPVASGQTQVSLGIPAIAATATAAAIPAVIYYTNTLAVDKSANYSLFLTGTSPSSVDNVLIKESYTRTYADSICGVRFINLAPGSNPVSVNIKGGANGSEVTTLAYKVNTDFKQYPAKRINPSYIFEFRDAGTGAVLTSYTMNTPFFHNVSLCLRGKTGAYGVILDNDY